MQRIQRETVHIPIVLVFRHHKLLVKIPRGDIVAAVVEQLFTGKAVILADLIQERLLHGERQIKLGIRKEVRAGAGERVLKRILVKRLHANRFIKRCEDFLPRFADVFAVIDVDEVIVIVFQARNDAADRAEAAGAVVRLGNVAHACDKVIRRDFVFGRFAVAVYPVNIRTEVERPNAEVLVGFPAFRHAGDGSSIFIGLNEAFYDVSDEYILGRSASAIRIHGRDGFGES